MNIEKQIELDKVKEIWQNLAVTEWAKEKISKISFYLNESELRGELRDTTNSKTLMEAWSTAVTKPYRDKRHNVDCSKGGLSYTISA